MDKVDVGTLDLLLKNILNVADSKFSTAKHLHEVCKDRNTTRLDGQDTFRTKTSTNVF